jgi:hypothetical protein
MARPTPAILFGWETGVVIADPLAWNPFLNPTKIEVTARDKVRVALGDGYGHMGEPVSLRRGKGGKVIEIDFAGYRYLPEAAVAAEMRKRYRLLGSGPASGASPRRARGSRRPRRLTG